MRRAKSVAWHCWPLKASDVTHCCPARPKCQASRSALANANKVSLLLQVQALQPQPATGVPAHRLPLRAAFAQVVRSEGLLSLWKGNGVTILHRLPYSAVNFWAYERVNELWNYTFPATNCQGQPALDVLRRFSAGAAAGMTACTMVGTPIGVLSKVFHYLYGRRW